ncbi:type II toxin-antitoxin system PemK/MazF family toxin [Microbispora hainanensis]|uniref:type II toxin-antitoxin system PemK/MazF family toxin n=1 Tax=Microbispora hainanensis TaxID=568844 RepID=UPI00142EEBFC|nr:type II toxin-antitoxin system PemK/MazF family toxin [Microbispora hainanensis]
MRRGEIWSIEGIGRAIGRENRLVLIISHDALAAQAPMVTTAALDQTGAAPETLVTVRITEPVPALVRLDTITSVRRERLAALAGRLSPEDQERVDIALRTALDL